MKRTAAVLVVLQFLVLSSLEAAEAAKRCSTCVGMVATAEAVGAGGGVVIPTLMTETATAGPALDTLTPEQRRAFTVVTSAAIVAGSDPLLQVEQQTTSFVDWARAHGPFDGIGINFSGGDAATTAYAIKRLAVTAQGQNVASRVVIGPLPLAELAKLYEAGAQAYFDALLVDGAEAAETAKWLAEKDPAKKIYALVTPKTPNAFFDLGRALADGASLAFLNANAMAPEASATFSTALANMNAALAGDYAYDATGKTTVLDAKANAIDMPVLTFVRGEDLRTMLIPAGDAAAAFIVSLPSDRFTRPRRVDAAGDREVTDVGSRGGRFLIGVQPVKQPFALTVDRSEKLDANVTREAIDVATRRGITVEEIIRNHQAYKSFQESIEPRYIAKNTTKLRFSIGDGGEVVEAAIEGDYFSDPRGHADWVWQDFYINGVRWKYGKIPELPLIQPEKVSQLPLDIHLTNEYRYQLVRETGLAGYHTYEVRFEPPPNAPASLPLYRGTVWIDSKTWARVRISMIQMNLTGEILSNEERVDFVPFGRDDHQPLAAADATTRDARTLLWLPRDVSAQQVISAAGRANVVLRSSEFTNFRIDPPDFDQAHASASASNARMLRETDAGLRYLEKTPGGERVVKEGFDTSRLFMLGGIHHDAGLEYPVVPLGGVDYFNFNLANTGIQANVFFAGVIVAANATLPNLANTRTNIGADFFALGVPVTNSMYRNGVEQKSEAVKSVPASLTLRVGHPFLQFGKVDASLGMAHLTYQRAEDTASAFSVPSDTFVFSPSVDASYARWGYVLSGFYTRSRRTKWEPWGNLEEYDSSQKSFANFGASLGKSFYLPKFQRIGLELNYLDGQRLDRFSKYELGFFGSQRVHGFQSGTVRAEKAMLGHLSYGFVFSKQFRLEAFYDHALIDDTLAGYSREPFQGVGIGGQTVGPWGTLVRLDLGKSIGRNAQDGFVASVVFLKLF